MRRMYETTEWRKAREFAIQRDGWVCRKCGKPCLPGHPTRGPQVDHIIPHRGDPRKFHDLGNLQLLCARCHSRKTLEERAGRRGDRGTGLDGFPK